jgi:putative ABC transport system permease protein
MILDYLSLAFRNLKKRGLRSWLTLLGIFIGVAAVVSLISLGNGLQTAVNSQFGVSSTEIISVQAGGLNSYGPPGSAVSKPLTIDDVKAINKLSVVKRAIRRNIPSGKLEFNDKVVFGIAMNVPYGDDRKFTYDALEVEPLKGRLLTDSDDSNVVLGYNFYADKVGLDKPVDLGDTVKLNDKSFKVVGITEKKGSFIFDNIIHVNENPLKDLMKYGDNVDLIAVQVKNKDLVERAKEDIEDLMRKRRNVKKGEEDFEVSTPEAALETVNSVLNGVKAFVALIALISVLVGALGIVNTMTTSVLERRKEIGIMKAIGAKNSHVFTQFLLEAGLLGLMGGFAGAIFGTLIGILGTIALNNFIGSSVSPNIDFLLIFLTLAGSFTIGAIAGIVPAMSAAKQSPVEALRG